MPTTRTEINNCESERNGTCHREKRQKEPRACRRNYKTINSKVNKYILLGFKIIHFLNLNNGFISMSFNVTIFFKINFHNSIPALYNLSLIVLVSITTSF